MTTLAPITTRITTLFLLSFFLLSTNQEAQAIVDPLSVANNKVGIHISDVSDIPIASELVNSNGGEWGYVTVVIREDQRELEQWQHFFDELRRKKLIPIVRIATRSEGLVWVRPLADDANKWADFLHSLNWVTKNRYVILFNEPNHAKEWGGSIDPAHYASMTNVYRDALKKKSDDFFVLPAGVDISADSNKVSLNPQTFYEIIGKTNPEYFTQFDGWTVHAYPNPNFSSPPNKKGRNTIWGYDWERKLLSEYGLPENIPLFITETGWIHNKLTKDGLEPELIGTYLADAMNQAWSDSQIVAITPFILRYDAAPFQQFSWMIDGEPLEHFTHYQALAKEKGVPLRDDKAQVVDSFLPETLNINSNYRVGFRLLNAGQSIWDEQNFALEIIDNENVVINSSKITPIEPGETMKIWLDLAAPNKVQANTISIRITLDEKAIMDEVEYSFDSVERMGILQPLRLWLERWFYEKEFIGSQDGVLA
jgi:hypothetical protein